MRPSTKSSWSGMLRSVPHVGNLITIRTKVCFFQLIFKTAHKLWNRKRKCCWKHTMIKERSSQCIPDLVMIKLHEEDSSPTVKQTWWWATDRRRQLTTVAQKTKMLLKTYNDNGKKFSTYTRLDVIKLHEEDSSQTVKQTWWWANGTKPAHKFYTRLGDDQIARMARKRQLTICE